MPSNHKRLTLTLHGSWLCLLEQLPARFILLPLTLPFGPDSPFTASTMAENVLKTDSKYDDYDFPSISPEKKPGHAGHTTPEQDAQIFQLRTQLEQAGCTQRLDTLSMV